MHMFIVAVVKVLDAMREFGDLQQDYDSQQNNHRDGH
jgi:hypothetical protein